MRALVSSIDYRLEPPARFPAADVDTDLAALVRSSTARRLLYDYLGCFPETCRSRYAAASPTSFVDPSDPPVLIASSTNEIVPLAQARELARRLAAAHVPHKLVVYPGTRHAQDYEADVWPVALRFLERYLGPAPG